MIPLPPCTIYQANPQQESDQIPLTPQTLCVCTAEWGQHEMIVKFVLSRIWLSEPAI